MSRSWGEVAGVWEVSRVPFLLHPGALLSLRQSMCWSWHHSQLRRGTPVIRKWTQSLLECPSGWLFGVGSDSPVPLPDCSGCLPGGDAREPFMAHLKCQGAAEQPTELQRQERAWVPAEDWELALEQRRPGAGSPVAESLVL